MGLARGAVQDRGWRTHAGVTRRSGPRFRVLGGWRYRRSASFGDVGDTAAPAGLGGVGGGQRAPRLLCAEPAQELRVPQPPFGIDGHGGPEPVKLGEKQRRFPGTRAEPRRRPGAGAVGPGWCGRLAHGPGPRRPQVERETLLAWARRRLPEAWEGEGERIAHDFRGIFCN